ncbi:MAG: hybrid sensor histidine kinase/response regulator [Coxiellaceae bacterium]|nr:hybrid sensor histidine kinase/response regulator [Coxiellaceae bacterium]
MEFDPEIYKELMKTFKGEFDEQIEELTESLLELEKPKKSTDRSELINKIFRIAHTIKGASRGVEINSIGDVSHHMEDIFSTIRQENKEISSDIIDVFFEAIDVMRSLLDGHINNKAPTVDHSDIVKKLVDLSSSINDCKSTKSNETATELDKDASAEESDAETLAQENSGEFDVKGDLSTDVIRVDVNKIDQVTVLSDELQGVKLELDDYYDEMQILKAKLSHISDTWYSASYLSKRTGDKQGSDELAALFHSGFDGLQSATSMLKKMHGNVNNTARGLGLVSAALQDKVRALRLVPVATVLTPMLRSARDMARELNKNVELTLHGEDIRIDRSVLAQAKDPLMHLLRNAIDHGIDSAEMRKALGKPEAGNIEITVSSESDNIVIEMKDDGQGIDAKQIKTVALNKKLISEEEVSTYGEEEILGLIFRPGFSTKEIITSLSGRGVGLDVVMENIQALKGTVSIKTEINKGTTFTLTLPLTLVSDRGVIVQVNNQDFAIPTTSIGRILSVDETDVLEVEAGLVIMYENKPIPLRKLSDALEIQSPIGNKKQFPVVVLQKGWQLVALVVDAIHGEREIVIKHLSNPLISVRNISGATLTGRGEVIIVLNPLDLVDSSLALTNTKLVQKEKELESTDVLEVARILVVDDSITTRTLETNILNIQGYEVDASMDGEDAWKNINEHEYDLIITDVEMPHMDGFELTSLIKGDDRYKDIPVIIVTSLESDDDKRKGIEVGADAYIVKNTFETKALLKTVEQLI